MDQEIESTLDIIGDFNRLLIKTKVANNVLTDAIDKLIELNKFRIKMKPISAREKYGYCHYMTLSILMYCPRCKSSVGEIDKIKKFCNGCGQAILT